jgi:hypothetical protein
MRVDNPATGLESHHHVRSAKTIRSRSRRRMATGERLWIPTYGDLLELIDDRRPAIWQSACRCSWCLPSGSRSQLSPPGR